MILTTDGVVLTADNNYYISIDFSRLFFLISATDEIVSIENNNHYNLTDFAFHTSLMNDYNRHRISDIFAENFVHSFFDVLRSV